MEPYELKRGAFKNLTLRIRPDGSLRVTAPWFVPRPLVDRFVVEKSAWIARKRQTLVVAPTATPLSEVWVWGVPHRVGIRSPGALPRVVIDEGAGEVTLRVPASWGPDRHRKILEGWEKDRVTAALGPLLAHWALRMGLQVDRWSVKRMRSRWGSCQPATRSLVFNSRLGALPPACLEHVVVHELVHLVEKSHNARFHALVDHWLPGSQTVRAMLRSGTGRFDFGAFPGPLATPGAKTEPGDLDR